MKYFEKLKVAAGAVDFLKRYGIYVVLLALIIFFSIASENFFRSSNLLNVARQVSMLGIAAVGFAFVLLVGGHRPVDWVGCYIGEHCRSVVDGQRRDESYFGKHFGIDNERSDRIH